MYDDDRVDNEVKLIKTKRDKFSKSQKRPPQRSKFDTNQITVFMVTYFLAVFSTILGVRGEACNTTTLTVVGPTTEFITSTGIPSTVTVIQYGAGFTGTSAFFPGLTNGTSTATEYTTVTVSSESTSQSASGTSILILRN